jgi:hypothetical protein
MVVVASDNEQVVSALLNLCQDFIYYQSVPQKQPHLASYASLFEQIQGLRQMQAFSRAALDSRFGCVYQVLRWAIQAHGDL